MAACAGMLLAGCAAVPGTGPGVDTFRAEAVAVVPRPASERFTLVSMDSQIARKVSVAFAMAEAIQPPVFLSDDPPPALTIGRGDLVEVAIVSKSDTGFIDFAQAAINPLATTILPVQEVGEDGRIQVPPLGRVRAAGLSAQRFETGLAASLGQVLVEPSVVVRVISRAQARVAVLGQVAQPGSFSLETANLRLVDFIARAGGQLAQAADLAVTLSRQGISASVRLDRLLATPALNIRVWPGDVIRIEPVRNRFTVLGATGANGEFEFARPRLTLTGALGQALGLLSDQADRRGVLVLRRTPASVLAGLGVATAGDSVATVYQFDLSQPDSLFAMGAFDILDGDLIFVSDAPAFELRKAFDVINVLRPLPFGLSNLN